MDSRKQVKIYLIHLKLAKRGGVTININLTLVYFIENNQYLTYVDDCVILSHKQETTTPLIDQI